MAKTTDYMVLDTETATLPFVSEFDLTADEKKKIAIARPLVYDIGWTICDRTHGVKERKNFLIAETFAVPSIFNTAYYKEKYPLYLDMLKNKEITLLPWNDVVEILIADLQNISYITAFNAMFDFCKAIPFTDLYISKLYSPDYQQWENFQRKLCWNIAKMPYKKDNEKDFDNMFFHLREEKYPMIDIWGLACENIINTPTYKRACLENSLISPSGMYFSTNAENVRRFIYKEYGFIEDHTALSDAEIETEILLKALKRGKKIEGIEFFPFRKLGYVSEFVEQDNRITPTMAQNALDILNAYIEQHSENPTPYLTQVFNHAARVEAKRDSLLWDD